MPLAILPAEAHAATLTPDHAYLEGDRHPTGTAFTPRRRQWAHPMAGSALTIAGPGGELHGAMACIRAPNRQLDPGTITATDGRHSANAATRRSHHSLGVSVDTSRGRKPDRRATFRARGFHVRSTLYVHYHARPGGSKMVTIGKLGLLRTRR